jgi:hypothetical protein
MQVLEKQDDRRVCRHHLERIRQLAQHARRCDARRPSLQRAELAGCLQRGQLRKPRGRELAQYRDRLLAS